MSDAEWPGFGDTPEAGTVAFDYIKSHDFRTVWVDGAIGGITPSGFVHFAIYSERPAIPRRQVFAVAHDEESGDRLGAEIAEKRISRDSIVREMSVDIVLSPVVAESLATWLLQQIEVLRKAQTKAR